MCGNMYAAMSICMPTSLKATFLRFVEERQMPLYELLNEAEAPQHYRRRVDFEKATHRKPWAWQRIQASI